jgi:hypothetical protein
VIPDSLGFGLRCFGGQQNDSAERGTSGQITRTISAPRPFPAARLPSDYKWNPARPHFLHLDCILGIGFEKILFDQTLKHKPETTEREQRGIARAA